MSPELHRFWIKMTADKRKFGVLCACFGVALLFWGRLVFLREVPRSAYADQESAQSAQASEASNSGGKWGAKAQAGPVSVSLRGELSRDPFALDPAHFPEPPQEEPVAEVQPKSPERLTDVESDEREDRRVQSAQEARSRLSLLSVAAGTEPVAMIEAKLPEGKRTLLVSVGHRIAGFRVVEIDVTGRTATVEKGDVRVTLSMKQERGS
jgi:hypothetical protein